MKYAESFSDSAFRASPLAMAEWIEILISYTDGGNPCPSPLAMAEWIEIFVNLARAVLKASPLAMAEWIEIGGNCLQCQCPGVSASDGGVD